MAKWTFTTDVNIGTRCPICKGDIDYLHDENIGDVVQESYTCDSCRMIFTFEWRRPARGGISYEDYEQAEREARDGGTLMIERSLV